MLTTSRYWLGEAPRQSKISMTAANRQAAFSGIKTSSRAAIAVGLFGSLVLLPLVMVQGAATRRRVPCLPPTRVCTQ